MAVRTTIYARSPYLIKVANPTQVGAKVELYIWKPGSSEPAQPTKTLSGKIPSINQRDLIFNISPYVREYIEQNHAITEDYDIVYTSNFNHCFVKVLRYYEDVSLGYVLMTTQIYNAVNGWIEYMNGPNSIPSNSTTYYPATDEAIKLLYNKDNTYLISNQISGISSFPFLLELAAGSTSSYSVTIAGYEYDLPTAGTSSATSLYCAIPIPFTENAGVYDIELLRNGNYYGSMGQVTFVDACKYIPINFSFVNKWGGIEWMTFFANNQTSFEVKGTEFKPYNRFTAPNTTAVSYDVFQGQMRDFNVNGTKTIKVNTGWVPENYGDRIYQLMHSESIKCSNLENNFQPVILKTKSMKIQKHLTEKTINYELEFEYAFDNINNVI